MNNDLLKKFAQKLQESQSRLWSLAETDRDIAVAEAVGHISNLLDEVFEEEKNSQLAKIRKDYNY